MQLKIPIFTIELTSFHNVLEHHVDFVISSGSPPCIFKLNAGFLTQVAPEVEGLDFGSYHISGIVRNFCKNQRRVAPRGLPNERVNGAIPFRGEAYGFVVHEELDAFNLTIIDRRYV